VVGQEVVIQTWQPVRAACEELDFGLNLQNKGVAGLDRSQNLLDALLELALVLAFQLLDDCIGTIDRDGGGNVVEGDGRVELISARRGEEPGVDLLKRHVWN